MNTSLKPSSQCKRAATKASQVLRQIRRNFHNRDKPTLRVLFYSMGTLAGRRQGGTREGARESLKANGGPRRTDL